MCSAIGCAVVQLHMHVKCLTSNTYFHKISHVNFFKVKVDIRTIWRTTFWWKSSSSFQSVGISSVYRMFRAVLHHSTV